MTTLDDMLSAYIALKLGATLSAARGKRVWIGIDGRSANIIAKMGNTESSAEAWVGDDIGTAATKAVSGLGG